MTDNNGTQNQKKPLTLSPKTLTLKKGVGDKHVRQSFSHGRSKTVTVEVKRKRVILPNQGKGEKKGEKTLGSSGLTQQQIQERLEALHGAIKTQVEEASSSRAKIQEQEIKPSQAEEPLEEPQQETGAETASIPIEQPQPFPPSEPHHKKKTVYSSYEDEDEAGPRRGKGGDIKAKIPPVKRTEPRRRSGKITVVQALRADEDKPTRSLAAMRRLREKRKMAGIEVPKQKVIREVVIPEVITVQELSNRLAERGADQVTLSSKDKITFIDTPGHAAFTEMRARGANVTDIVVLVVAADDGVKDQTIEAIHHAKAANVPIIIAINKMDKPGANPEQVRNMLMQHEIFLEKVGGDILDVEVSAKTGLNLNKLEETILLQAEILELKANPDRTAEGVVVESKLERGRGVVSTVLVQKGTLRVGDLFVAGAEYGRVRALIDDRSHQIDAAGPSVPVEVLGFNGAPMAGDDFVVVENENRAREISEFRHRRAREAKSAISVRDTMEQMFSKISEEGEVRELPLIIKSDVQGSMEAISGSLARLSTEEVKVKILHQAVGEITESDVTLAKASRAMIIGFNVRANPQAREAARRDGIEIRYYSIIYDVVDDIKAALGGLLAPTLREKYLGKAQIRNIFSIPKVGKVAGCMITEGLVKRDNKVRLLRDNIVIHEGSLKSLKRFNDEVKEVREGYECGMAFENYNDIKENDSIECFEIEEISRTLD